jgi:hypothetical protein
MCQSYSLKQYCDKDIKYHPCINNLKPNVNEYFTSKNVFKSRPLRYSFPEPRISLVFCIRKFVNFLVKIRYSLATHGILKIFSNYSIFQGQQKYYRHKLDNTKDILVVFRYIFLIGWMKHSKSLGRD